MSDVATVLIVDDEAEILETVRRRLLVEGIHADTCEDPLDAVSKMEDNLYAIAVCDIKMPGMSGIELLQQIKKVNPLCTVVMMTGYSSMSNVVDCLGNGAADYFVKPFRDIDSLVEAVNHAIARIARWREAMPLGHAEVR
jgi:DNA-binding NtrC family response regulator